MSSTQMSSTMFSGPVSQIRYGLEPTQHRELLRHFANRVAPFCNSRRHAPVIVVGIAGDDPLANLARHIECQRFQYSTEEFHHEFDAWEPSTHFLMAVDTATLRPVGALRGIVTVGGVAQAAKSIRDTVLAADFANHVRFDENGEPLIDLRDRPSRRQLAGLVGESTLPSERTFDRQFIEAYHGIEPGETIYDVATLCNTKGKSALLRSIGPILCAASYRMAQVVQSKHMVAIVRADLFSVLTRLMGTPFVPLAGVGTFKYCTPDRFASQPAYQSMPAVRQRAMRELRRSWTGEESSFGRSHAELMHLCASPEADELFLF